MILQQTANNKQQADAAPILLQNGVHLEVRCAQRPAEHCPQVLLVLAGAAPLDGVVPCANEPSHFHGEGSVKASVLCSTHMHVQNETGRDCCNCWRWPSETHTHIR